MKLTEIMHKHGTSQAALADVLGITQGAISQWIDRGIVPAEHCPTIEKYFRGAIRCEDLNNKIDWAYLRATGKPKPPAERRKNPATPQLERETVKPVMRVKPATRKAMT